MGEAAEALGRAVAGLPEPSRQPFSPVLAGLRARATGGGDAALARALAGIARAGPGRVRLRDSARRRTTSRSAGSPSRSSVRAC